MYYLLPIFLFSTIFAIPYEEGEYVSEEHQNITKETCYGGNGYVSGDPWKLADWNGELNGGHYNIVYVEMAASWWGPCYSKHNGQGGQVHQIFEDYDNVKFLIAFSDPNQPYSCREWGQMPDGGSSQIISDTNSSIWGLFQSGGAFPSSALLNHEMMVYDKNPSIFALDDIIPEEIENNTYPDSCSGVTYGDINYDGTINVVDAIFIIQYILGNDTSGECTPDINQDGIVDVTDIVTLLNFILE